MDVAAGSEPASESWPRLARRGGREGTRGRGGLEVVGGDLLTHRGDDDEEEEEERDPTTQQGTGSKGNLMRSLGII